MNALPPRPTVVRWTADHRRAALESRRRQWPRPTASGSTPRRAQRRWPGRCRANAESETAEIRPVLRGAHGAVSELLTADRATANRRDLRRLPHSISASGRWPASQRCSYISMVPGSRSGTVVRKWHRLACCARRNKLRPMSAAVGCSVRLAVVGSVRDRGGPGGKRTAFESLDAAWLAGLGRSPL